MMKVLIALLLVALSTPAFADPKAAGDKRCAARQEGPAEFSVTKTKKGYVLHLPPGLLKQFRYEAEYRVVLTATNGETGTISGIGVKDGDYLLNVSTSQVFALPSIDRNSIKSLDIAPQGVTLSTILGDCDGCPRSSGMQCLSTGSDECSICFCLEKTR